MNFTWLLNGTIFRTKRDEDNWVLYPNKIVDNNIAKMNMNNISRYENQLRIDIYNRKRNNSNIKKQKGQPCMYMELTFRID